MNIPIGIFRIFTGTLVALLISGCVAIPAGTKRLESINNVREQVLNPKITNMIVEPVLNANGRELCVTVKADTDSDVMSVTNMAQTTERRKLVVGLCPGYESIPGHDPIASYFLANVFTLGLATFVPWVWEGFRDWTPDNTNSHAAFSLFGYAKTGKNEGTVYKDYYGATQRRQYSGVPISGVTIKCAIPQLNFESTQPTDTKGVAGFFLKKGTNVTPKIVDVCLVATGKDAQGAMVPETKTNVSIDFTYYQRWIDQEEKAAKALEENKRQVEENARQAKVKRDEALAAVMIKADQIKGNTLVFKGFYIGMPMEDANILCEKHNISQAITLRDGKLIELCLNSDQIKQLFGLKEIDASDFVNRFAREYETPSPKYISGDVQSGGFGDMGAVASDNKWKITDGKTYEVIFMHRTGVATFMGITGPINAFTLTLRRPQGSFN